MTINTRRPSLEEVLDEFFFATDAPSAGAVLRACEAHPEFRHDILEFAALWIAHDDAPEPAAEDLHVPPGAVSRLQSYALNSLHADATTTASGVGAAQAALDSLAGGALRRAAVACGLSTATELLGKVLTNLIVDVPHLVVIRLAAHLEVAVQELQAALAAQPEAVIHRSASRKPNAPGQETWAHAVDTLSGADADEKARLLALADERPQA